MLHANLPISQQHTQTHFFIKNPQILEKAPMHANLPISQQQIQTPFFIKNPQILEKAPK